MRTRNLVSVAVLGLAATTALGACSNSNDSGGLSGGSSSGGGGGATYTVAFEGPLSGDNAQLGINEVNAAQLAVDQANQKGDLGFTLKLLKADDVGDPSKAPAAAAQILQDNTVMGVIGPSFSGTTKAVGKTFGDAGLAIVNPSASNGTLQTLGFKTWHRVNPNDFAEGPAAADWLAKKAKKVFVVDDLSDYGSGVAAAVIKELKAKGVTVQHQGVDAKTTDYGAISQTVKNSGADAVFYAGYDAQGALFTKALTAVGYKGIRMAGNGVKSSVFTEGAGAAGNGFYFSCGCQDATVAPSAKDFTAAYQKMFNTPPSTYSPEAYDATNILINAIKAAKAAGSVTRATVNEQVNKTDYEGITGHIKFGTDGDLAKGSGTVNLYEQKDGKIVSLGDITKAS
ncbi:Putative Leu/Ile/Val-binding protein (livJ) [Nostocoides japonicum T1-X7]|uniref:Putative Leu/Ile/Val-binding protein (LivJ) n=1 Tax=Nostocoides japonicum T1-X7 TaxID=1194083 RepID=A0A077M2M9_9MICO|nr:branched-chain amino acid ABC transporter substrate-binding protein [Tetrasphaera japonica]CCH80071.1 Putative Leu/Ile/Val-binding protein (livJ) [Tetrasphaera japonica T1-X7]